MGLYHIQCPRREKTDHRTQRQAGSMPSRCALRLASSLCSPSVVLVKGDFLDGN